MAYAPSRNCERRSGKFDGKWDMWYCGPRGAVVWLRWTLIGWAVILDRMTLRSSHNIFLGLSGKMSMRCERRRLREVSCVVREVNVWSR